MSDTQQRIDDLAKPPPHLTNLREDAEAALEAVNAPQEKEEGAPQPSPPNPKDGREYQFTLSYRDRRGKLWTGEFTSKILTIRERQAVGIMRARLANGLPFESLDALTLELNLMIAHMTFSLTARPKWAEELDKLDDFGVLQAIYQEVASHEAHFLGS